MNRDDILRQLELAEKHLDNAIALEDKEWLGARFRGHIRKALTEIALARESMSFIECSSCCEWIGIDDDVCPECYEPQPIRTKKERK